MGAVTGRTDVNGYDYIWVNVPGNETAGTATYEVAVEMPSACVIYEVTVLPGADITGANTNTRHLNLDVPRGSQIGNIDYVLATDGTAGTSADLYDNATGTSMTAGQILTIENELIGTGQAIPQGWVCRIKLQWR